MYSVLFKQSQFQKWHIFHIMDILHNTLWLQYISRFIDILRSQNRIEIENYLSTTYSFPHELLFFVW